MDVAIIITDTNSTDINFIIIIIIISSYGFTKTINMLRFFLSTLYGTMHNVDAICYGRTDTWDLFSWNDNKNKKYLNNAKKIRDVFKFVCVCVHSFINYVLVCEPQSIRNNLKEKKLDLVPFN